MQTLKVREKKVSVHTYNYDNIIEFLNITKDILENSTVKQMKNFSNTTIVLVMNIV